jgi:UDP-N-acetylmuramyl pentapeptide phosphotransferase/UDP-N-acetylglucosamine-1-phosphate transferase
MASLSVIIPAYNAQDSIRQTLRAAAASSGGLAVSQIIVVDDGSRDATAAEAQATLAEAGVNSCPTGEQAEVRVIRLEQNLGKGGALRRGLEEATGDLVLLLDADLGESAALASALVEPVARGEAEMTIAHFIQVSGSRGQGILHPSSFILHPCGSPSPDTGHLVPESKGGFGLVVRLARWGIYALTGLKMKSPLSGQRCLPRALAEKVGIAEGFGVEVGLTLEVFRQGGRILEVPLPMTHAATGKTLAGFTHRGRQFMDALLVLLANVYGIGWPRIKLGRWLVRLFIWTAAISALPVISIGFPLDFRAGVFLSLDTALAMIILLHILAALAGWFKQNYAGLRIPASFGLIFPFVWLVGQSFCPAKAAFPAGLLLILAWAVLGLLDDRFGSRSAQGFKGHLRALLEGRLTTGALKLLAGGGVSLLAGWLVSQGNWPAAILNGLLIALCTNLLNLLDLRPGRGLKAFFILGIIAWGLNPEAALLLVPLFAAALVYAPLDFSARAMMGDVGSNTLGAMAGLALALSLGLAGKIVLLLILVGVHIYAEVGSLSALIERLPLLRRLDRLGRAEE